MMIEKTSIELIQCSHTYRQSQEIHFQEIYHIQVLHQILEAHKRSLSNNKAIGYQIMNHVYKPITRQNK